MSKFTEADFYYGAVLSHCFHKGFKPIMLEGGDKRQVYECTTDTCEFKLFTKYRTAPIQSKTEGYNSWQFVFSLDDIREIRKFMSEDGEFSMGLVCGTEPLNQSEIAFLHKDEIAQILAANKTSITIGRMKNERKFRISMGGGRDNAMQIPTNRMY